MPPRDASEGYAASSALAVPPRCEPLARIGPGARLGDYEILRLLGTGGMARVWLGRKRAGGFERRVAVKTTHPHLAFDRWARDSLARELEIAASIHHANVVAINDAGEAAGITYLVMGLVEGADLRQILDRSLLPLAPSVLVSICLDALRGLHAAHESLDSRGRPRRLVHRDVSPQNLLVGLDGTARICDFGIARVFGSAGTTIGHGGKFAYSAPEQAAGDALDRRADVFAMGIVLWECLTNERLFLGPTATESVANVMAKPVPHPADVRSGASRALGDVAMRALERAPARRHPTAAAMLQELGGAARADGIVPSSDDVAGFVAAIVAAPQASVGATNQETRRRNRGHA